MRFDLLKRVASASNTDPGQSEFGQQRRPQRETDMVLTGTTRRWLRQLPLRRRPVRLCELYPRVANRIAFAWPDVRVSGDLLEDLLLDRRGGRQGFSSAVTKELRRLRDFNAQHRIETQGESVWERAGRLVGFG